MALIRLATTLLAVAWCVIASAASLKSENYVAIKAVDKPLWWSVPDGGGVVTLAPARQASLFFIVKIDESNAEVKRDDGSSDIRFGDRVRIRGVTKDPWLRARGGDAAIESSSQWRTDPDAIFVVESPLGTVGGPVRLGNSFLIRGVTRDGWIRAEQDGKAAIVSRSKASKFAMFAAANRVWFEWGIAAVTVGYDVNNGPIDRKFYVAVHGPTGQSTGLAQVVTTCTKQAGSKVGDELRRELWAMIPPPAEKPNSADGKIPIEAIKRRYAPINEAIQYASLSLPRRLKECNKDSFDASEFSLALVERICHSGACKAAGGALDGSATAKAFGTLIEWLEARGTGITSLPVNSLVGINGDANTKIGPLQYGLVLEATEWPKHPAIAEMQKQFEDGVRNLRRLKRKFASAAPRALSLPREVAFRTLDAVGDPAQVMGSLPSDPQSTLIGKSLDELAKLRIKECVRFGGKIGAEEVGKCAGYTLDDATIKSCLRGGECAPPLAPQALAASVLITDLMTPKEMARAALLPRLSTLGQAGELAKVYDECVKSVGGDKGRALNCVMQQKLGPQEKLSINCVKTHGAKVEAIECAAAGKVSAHVIDLVSCQRAHPNDGAAATSCMLRKQLPKEASALLDCAQSKKGKELATCVAAATGGEAAKVLACIQQNDGKWADAGACAFGDKMPKEAQAAVSCAQTSEGDRDKFAGCMAAGAVPPEWRKAAQCLAESQGDAMTAGVCMVADDMNAEARIALQCAATTGGEPVSFATCVGGRLAMKELVQCTGRKFGEGPCFGENNEFRKLARNLLGSDIGPNSEIGKIVNVQLDFVKMNVGAAQAVAQGVGNLAENVKTEAERAAEDVTKAYVQQAQTVLSVANTSIQWAASTTGTVASSVQTVANSIATTANTVAAPIAQPVAATASAVGAAVGGVVSGAGAVTNAIGGAISSCCRW